MDRGPLLHAHQLADFTQPLMLDVRWYLDGRDGYQSYLNGHYPGAVFVDLDLVATAADGPAAGRHPLPSTEHFVKAITTLGVEPQRQVIIMDDVRGSVAARIWWMLDALGIEAYVLGEGLDSLNDVVLCKAPCDSTPASPWPSPRDTWPEHSIVTTNELESDPSRFFLLDARARARYLGDEEPIDRVGGHIPGATSLPWSEILDLLASERWQLSPLIQDILANDRVPVAYCGSGVTACTLILAFRTLGRDVKLYPPSYSGWSSDPAHPICRVDCGHNID
jgi:thiosulfate/3-mercaptopyruvate sulfurtransferase